MHERLGIITGTPAFRADGRLWLNHSNGRVFDALLERFPSARILVPEVPKRARDMQHPLAFAPDRIDLLPPLVSTIEAQRHFGATLRAVRRFARDREVLFIRFPFQVAPALLGLGRPKVLHVVSNPVEVVRVSTDYRGAMAVAARAFSYVVELAMRGLVYEPRTAVVTNGAEMWARLEPRRGRVTVSSCLRADEIRPRAPGARGDPPSLLFVGYLRPEKGVDVLLDAFERLRARRPLKLVIVGGTDRAATGIEGELQARIDRSVFAADIVQRGMLDFGPELFDAYRAADVYVLPSRSEGTPRTLVEARAFGVPSVASAVGGVVTSLRHEVDGLLVPPGDAAALAAAIERLLDDEALRARLVDAGVRVGAERTLDRFVDELSAEIEAIARA